MERRRKSRAPSKQCIPPSTYFHNNLMALKIDMLLAFGSILRIPLPFGIWMLVTWFRKWTSEFSQTPIILP